MDIAFSGFIFVVSKSSAVQKKVVIKTMSTAALAKVSHLKKGKEREDFCVSSLKKSANKEARACELHQIYTPYRIHRYRGGWRIR